MNEHEQWIFFRGIIVGRLVQDSFDRCAVLALPADDFGCAEDPVTNLCGEVGKFARLEFIYRRDVKLGRV